MAKLRVQHGKTPFIGLLTILQSGWRCQPEERITPNALIEQLAMWSTGYTPDPSQELKEPAYYDYPVLKAPVWKWEIVWYFFFGGLAAGCYFIASIASLF